ncbi:hypothetical protein H8S90_07040 [Olivibacter sp. SDN3]|uniref:hypothetical protein n=1 Tax=Olivibacter sp. SDN3 TaxID=2764720 RepID=UPI0016514AA1|nr:hypothetical protein [Olivibacter sp. SDN3]QNL51323.1 hypothetical protein H8S90_07040 [Olivibacter sp. SDN3]
MKNRYPTFTCVILFCLAFLDSYGQNTTLPPTLSSINIQEDFPGYLEVGDEGSPKEYTLAISFVRPMSPTGSFVQTTIRCRAVCVFNGSETVISSVATYSSNDFQGAFLDKTLKIQIPASATDSQVFLKWEYYIFENNEYSVGTLSSTFFSTQPSEDPGGPSGPEERTIPKVWEDLAFSILDNLSSTDFFQQTRFWPSNRAPILREGQSYSSRNNQYTFKMQTDGNLVLYRNSDNVALWASTSGGPIVNGTYEFWWEETGEMVIYRVREDGMKVKIWSSSTYVDPNSDMGINAKYGEFLIQNDGNCGMYFRQTPNRAHVLPFRTQTYDGTVSPEFGVLR